MRGIEAALHVWSEVREGKFASEVIRRLADSMTPGDLMLASTLVYTALRRQFLWKEIYAHFLKASPAGVSRLTDDALCIGTAGLLELRKFAPRVLVNALVQYMKDKGDERGARLVNAVLRRVSEEGRNELARLESSGNSKEQALVAGIPPWVASYWRNTIGDEAKKLLKIARIRPYSSFRILPEDKMDAILEQAKNSGICCWPSPLVPYSIRLSSTIYPGNFPGYSEGWSTPQSESSMLVGEVMKKVYKGGAILEMCSGRGVKTGHIARLFPEAHIECVELSQGRVGAAVREMKRLNIRRLPVFTAADALHAEPASSPAFISLDAPCSGSGTWNRHPEGKWRLSAEKLESLALLQRNLLKKAVSLLAPGGIVVYSTCSLLKTENENVVAGILSEDASLVELSFPFSAKYFRRGRPWGVYIWPELPWLDGFYMAVIMKRSGGKDC
ncbi:MAG: RsmB/NOP family class I SAM-dependent RNA methyltransferase [Synergistaceae bacterium]|nr:RsmB/NOP family class I SAM-dependent RNA methyltransferase [Synergistaceae bacterium]